MRPQSATRVPESRSASGKRGPSAAGSVSSSSPPASPLVSCSPSIPQGAIIIAPAVVAFVIFSSLVIVQPGQTRVVRFFGSYVGTVRRTGLSWILPLTDRRNVSIRVRNFETNHLKVNDADGNPVEIASIVVWQVADTARALFAVDDYLNFVRVQAESALRHVASRAPLRRPHWQRPLSARFN